MVTYPSLSGYNIPLFMPTITTSNSASTSYLVERKGGLRGRTSFAHRYTEYGKVGIWICEPTRLLTKWHDDERIGLRADHSASVGRGLYMECIVNGR